MYLHFTHGSATTYAMTESSHNRLRLASVLVWNLVCACNRSEGPPPPPPPAAPSGYAGDIAKICDVVVRSGAAQLAGPDRMYATATWLAANLETAEARAFLARIQPLEGAAKADALDGEARRVGLATCTLAGDWRT